LSVPTAHTDQEYSNYYDTTVVCMNFWLREPKEIKERGKRKRSQPVSVIMRHA
jgi:hypothetical protein